MKLLQIIFLTFVSSLLLSQENNNEEMYIGGDQVVLSFTKEQWVKGLTDKNSPIQDFKDFEIIEAINQNKIEGWSKNNWSLMKVGTNRYELRKKVKEFKDDYSEQIKFLINSDLWEGPVSESKSKELSKIKTIKVSKNGNVLLKLNGNSRAKKVILSGSFNKWKENELLMNKTKEGWELKLEVPPGIYEYKFIVDREWTHDKNNPLSVLNEHQTFNSILLVGETHTFKLNGYKNHKKIILSGSFNNWNEHSMAMKKTKTGWEISVPLPPGKHYYKFIVDDTWITDPDNILQQRDSDSHLNSVLLIH